MRFHPTLVLVLAAVLVAGPAAARFAMVETETVPIDRLIANLERGLAENPGDADTLFALARAHSLAYARKGADVAVRRDNQSLWFGYQPEAIPFEVEPADDEEAAAAAARHLAQAIELFQDLLAADAGNQLALLGMSWCLDQQGENAAAAKGYRKVLRTAWTAEKDERGRFGPSLVVEVAGYLIPLLEDANEVDEIKGMVDVIESKPRAVTPIVIPLAAGARLGECVDEDASVEFDLDGSGIEGRRWQWITPRAGWLVHDPRGEGRITSGLQLFGAVTFWIFWSDGYRALAALDDDGDGRVAGDELAGLALWVDADGDGVSSAGEVRPLAEHGIVALSVTSEVHESGCPWSPAGAVMADGTTRPTWDWIAHTRD